MDPKVAYIKSEKKICTFMLVLGVAFVVLLFCRNAIGLQYYFFFTTLGTFGIVFCVYYIWRWLQLKKVQTFDATLLKQHLEVQKQRVESQRNILQWIMLLAGISLIIGFVGIYKSVLGGTSLAVLFACALWFSAELFSEWHTKECMRKH